MQRRFLALQAKADPRLHPLCLPDAMLEATVAGSGAADPGPKQDYGFMYGRSFQDPDGRIWEPMWMDEAAMQSCPEAA